MIELKGMEFTLLDWTLTGNGPRPPGNAPGLVAADDTNESFIQVYIGYDQTVLVEGMKAHNNIVKLGQFFKIVKNYDEANVEDKAQIVPSFHLSGCTFRDNVGGHITSIYAPGDYPDLEVKFSSGTKFINNYGPVTNDFYAKRIKVLTMEDSVWGETRKPGDKNPRLDENNYPNYKAKFMVVDDMEFPLKIRDSTFDCDYMDEDQEFPSNRPYGNVVDEIYDIFKHQVGKTGDRSVFKFERESELRESEYNSCAARQEDYGSEEDHPYLKEIYEGVKEARSDYKVWTEVVGGQGGRMQADRTQGLSPDDPGYRRWRS